MIATISPRITTMKSQKHENLRTNGKHDEKCSNESDQNTYSRNDILLRITHLKMQCSSGTATGTRSQSQTHTIFLRQLKDTNQSLALFQGPPQCHLTEIIKPNVPRANCPRTIYYKYTKIQYQNNGVTFRAVFRAELLDGSSLITERYVIAIKSYEDKEKWYNTRCVTGGHLDIMKDYLVHGAKTIQCVLVHIILVVAKIKRFCVWVVDVKLAYL